jgi:hypothetical protein
MRAMLIVPLLLIVAAADSSAQANPALEGYSNYASLSERVEKLNESPLASMSSIGKTLGEREVFVITLGGDDAAKKPAIAVIGNVEPGHVVGSELALRMAEQLVANAETDEATKRLLEQFTIYVIPRVSPDATEKLFAQPYRDVAGNLRPTDDDRDGVVGDDPPDDLNGDGFITMMRIADEEGRWSPHPADPRVMIEVDRKKNERGAYRLLTEGRDNDGDGQFNEDASDGVNFNRNWPHRYQPFTPGTGPNAVSEIETRAVADFLYDHTNILAVLCFSPQDNLFHPWKPDAGKDKARIRTTVLSSDAPYHDFLAGKYRSLHEGKDAPESTWPGGTFAEWSYFQFGRWTFAARGWWVPKVPEMVAEGEKPSEEKRGADELNALRWFAQEKIDGFVDWQEVEHPDFPGQKVEVGGFKPLFRESPPAGLLGDLAARHVKFLHTIAEHRPQVAFGETKAEPLGSNVVRVTTTVRSTGYLPTLSEMGEVTGIHQRLQVQLEVPEGTVFLKGPPRVKLSRIDAGGKREVLWLIRFAEAVPENLKLRLWSPEIGEMEHLVEVAARSGGNDE